MNSPVQTIPVAATKPRLTSDQIRGFWAAWAGWALDGMNSFIYALVLVPALRDLLPRSGVAATAANIGFYGGLLFALFLIGWGLSLVWGPFADRFGRVRTLCLTILFFSVFAMLSGLATNVWALAIFRLLSGVGIGGEWSMGGTLIAEAWPEERRKMGAGLMHTGYYFGFFLAAIANYFFAERYGWRVMFFIGSAPGLLIACDVLGRAGAQPLEGKAEAGPRKIERNARFFAPFFARISQQDASELHLHAGFHHRPLGGSVYVPAAVTYLALGSGHTAARAAQLASYGTMLSINRNHPRLHHSAGIGRTT